MRERCNPGPILGAGHRLRPNHESIRFSVTACMHAFVYNIVIYNYTLYNFVVRFNKDQRVFPYLISRNARAERLTVL